MKIIYLVLSLLENKENCSNAHLLLRHCLFVVSVDSYI